MRSGVGRSSELARLGVTPMVELPGVGQSLQEHCGVRFVRETRIPSMNIELRGPGAIAAAARSLLGHGPLTNLVRQASAFFLADDTDPTSKVKMSLFPFGYDFSAGRWRFATAPLAMASLDLCWPRSAGRVSLRSADALEPPRIDYAMLSAPTDRAWLVAAVRKAQALFDSPALQRVFGRAVAPSPELRTDDEIGNFIAGDIGPFFHASGTCRMGSRPDAVVDERLRVHGVRNLRVADTSVFPDILSVNTNATAMMVGERAADFIRADLR
jgi:choline dehydrogenase-like flavoprotein